MCVFNGRQVSRAEYIRLMKLKKQVKQALDGSVSHGYDYPDWPILRPTVSGDMSLARARQLNLKVMIGSMNESSIGSAAIAHLAPLADFVDADGPLLLSEDVATGLQYELGNIMLADAPGLGIVPKNGLL